MSIADRSLPRSSSSSRSSVSPTREYCDLPTQLYAGVRSWSLTWRSSREACFCTPISCSPSTKCRKFPRWPSWSSLRNSTSLSWWSSRRAGAAAPCCCCSPSQPLASVALCTGDEARAPETWTALPASSSCSSDDPCRSFCGIRPSWSCCYRISETARTKELDITRDESIFDESFFFYCNSLFFFLFCSSPDMIIWRIRLNFSSKVNISWLMIMFR